MKRYFSKTIIALLISSFAFAGSDVSADRSWSNEHRGALMADPIGWTSGNFRLAFEYSINDRVAFFAPIGFGVKEAVFTNQFFRGSYFAPKFGVKYYVTGKATHQGFYVSPLLGLFVGKGTNATSSTGGISYGFRTGYSWNIWRGVYVDSYLGYENLATSFNDEKSNTAVQPPAEGGLALGTALANFHAGMMLGYQW